MPDIQDLPKDTAYNKPSFQDLDLSKLGKIREGTPRPAAFVMGLYTVLTPEGYTTHMALSHSTHIHAIQSWDDVTEILCHDQGYYFIYGVYEAWAIDSLLKFLPLGILTKLYTSGYANYYNAQLWYTPGHKLTILKDKREARLQVLGNWSKRLTMRNACRRAGAYYDLGDPLSVAQALRTLGNSLLKQAQTFLGKKWGDISTPSVLTKQVLSRDLQKVDPSQIPLPAMELAYASLHAPWIEMISQGFFPDVYDYDLNSAYPQEISKLIICDERAGHWFQSSNYLSGKVLRQGANYLKEGGTSEGKPIQYGFAQAIVEMREGPGQVSPIRFRKNTGQLFSPYGTWVANLAKPEIDFIREHKLGTVTILNGWWFTPTEKVHPFLRTVHRLLELRKNAQDPILKAMMKSIAARMNGHFLQKLQDLDRDWIAGPMFNPIYACEVMTQTKLRLAEMSYQAIRRGGKVLAVTVDGLVTDTKLPMSSDKKLEARSPAVIVAPLVMHLEGREGRYNILKELWNAPEKRTYQFGEDRRVELKEALMLERPELIAKIEPTPVQIRVGADVTRIWDDLPSVGQDLLSENFTSKQPPIEYCTMRGGRGKKSRIQ